MEDDQQYCLRWNNHQSTLISVFENLLASEKLVDCTIAAEGKILRAHKVVLSACSPYFATLIQEQYDKHPIFILKDVKYQEMRAMMDYMYRGEVNISQDQLSALLKTAESLQIKGLSDNRNSAAPQAKPDPQLQQQQHQQPLHRGKLGAGYTLEQTKRARMGMDVGQDVTVSREGSSSPSRSRRRKIRRRSIENDAHDNSNSSMLQAAVASNQSILQQTNAASALVATQMPIIGGGATIAANLQQQPLTTTTNVTKKTESAKGTSTSSSAVAAAAASAQQTTTEAMDTDNVQIAGGSIGQGGAVIVDEQVAGGEQKSNHKQQKLSKEASTSSAAAAAAAAGGELIIEPKAEYDDEGHEETVEDLTLDDEEMGMEELDQTAGTSQGGEGSSQGYAAWQHDRSQEELLLASQDAQQRDPQDDFVMPIPAHIKPQAAMSKQQQRRRVRLKKTTTTTSATLPLIRLPLPLPRQTSLPNVAATRTSARRMRKRGATKSTPSSSSAVTVSPSSTTRSSSRHKQTSFASTSLITHSITTTTCSTTNDDEDGASNATSSSSTALWNLCEGEKPFVCRNCGRSYQGISTLNRHLRSECNQPKKFVCNVCGRGFYHKFKLNDHCLRLHTRRFIHNDD